MTDDDHDSIDRVPDGILVHDGERVVDVNAAMLPLAGAHRRTEVVGLPVTALLEHPYLREVAPRLRSPRLEPAPAPVTRDRLHRLDGAVCEVEVRTHLFLDGHAPRAHLLVRDVTARLEAERHARLADAQALADARDEELRALAGGVAHQLNNALQIVVGFAGLLAQEVPAPQQAEVAEILRAAARGATVTRRLLQFAGRPTHHPRTVDLGALVPEIVAALPQPRMPQAPRITVVVDAAPSVLIDPDDVREIVEELLENACRATPATGTIVVTVAVADALDGVPTRHGAPLPAGRYATVTVRDSGCGMPPEVLQRLFEPFFTTTPHGAGAGLGLPAVDGLVMRSGGALDVMSAPGDGATFTVWLPLLPTDTAAAGA
ncbi:MAG: PAS domain-containing sensor histidine kinase [Gemmatimonadaceae bacterium]|nr:PAS domain-containing sensor histidine kinase [Gemmatimonadaceae bacterium]